MLDKFPLPKQFLQQLSYDFQGEDFSCAFEGKNVVTFRLLDKSLLQESNYKNLFLCPIPFISNAYFLYLPTQTERQTLGSLAKVAKVYIQSLPSMLVVYLAHLKGDEKVIDLCASPGSKASMIAEKLQDSSQLYLNDISFSRLQKLEKNMQSMGFVKCHYFSDLTSSTRSNLQNFFDLVVADVPCSMEGRFDVYDRSSLDQWSVKKSKNLANLSIKILQKAFEYCHVGGRIIFATCTLNQAENEAVIAKFAQEKGQKIKILDLSHFSLPELAVANKSIALKVRQRQHISNPNLVSIAKKSLLILPDENFAGFFISILQKEI